MLKKNFIYSFGYQIISLGFPLIVSPYISRTVGADGIGLYAFYYSTAYYFVMFIMLGLSNYGNRSIAMNRDKSKNEFSRVFCEIYTMQFVCGVIVSALYIIYVIVLCEDKKMGLIFGLYVFSAVIDISWFFFGIEEFKLIVTRNLFVKIATMVFIFVLVKDTSDYYLYSLIMVLGMLVSQIYLWKYIFKYVDLKVVSISIALKKRFYENFVLFIPVFAVSLYKIMDKIMLGNMCPIAELGYYENVEKITNVPVAFVTALGTVMLPRVTNMVSKGDVKLVNRYFENSLYFALCVSSAMCFGIVAVSKEFVVLFWGENFTACIQLIYIMLPTTVFLGVSNVIRTQYLIPQSKDSIYIKSVCLGAFINLLINIVLIPSLGSTGAAIGTFFAELSVLLYQCIRVNKWLKLGRIILKGSGFLVLGLLMLLVLTNMKLFASNLIISLLIKVIVGGIIYAIGAIVYIVKVLRCPLFLRCKKI